MTDKNKISMYSDTKTSNIILSLSLSAFYFALFSKYGNQATPFINVWLLHLQYAIIPPKATPLLQNVFT